MIHNMLRIHMYRFGEPPMLYRKAPCASAMSFGICPGIFPGGTGTAHRDPEPIPASAEKKRPERVWFQMLMEYPQRERTIPPGGSVIRTILIYVLHSIFRP